jgi:hypothetical protein
MKRSLCVAMLCVLLLASQFGCANNKQPKAVTEKTVPSANAVAASPEVEDLNRLISKLSYYRSPKNLQAAKPQSIEEIKATFGKQAPDVDPAIEGIYKELSDKYKSDQEFLLVLNHVFLKYLFMIEDEPRFTALINQMPADYVYEPRTITYRGEIILLSGSLETERSMSKEDLLRMLGRIKAIDLAIKNSIGKYEKLLAFYKSKVDKHGQIIYFDPYSSSFLEPPSLHDLFARQGVEINDDRNFGTTHFYPRIFGLNALLLNTLQNDSSLKRLAEVLKRISLLSLEIFSPKECSIKEYQEIVAAINNEKDIKSKILRSYYDGSPQNHIDKSTLIYKISDHFFIKPSEIIQVPNNSVRGYWVFSKNGETISLLYYFEEIVEPFQET